VFKAIFEKGCPLEEREDDNPGSLIVSAIFHGNAANALLRSSREVATVVFEIGTAWYA
jgi:hypothetical protein